MFLLEKFHLKNQSNQKRLVEREMLRLQFHNLFYPPDVLAPEGVNVEAPPRKKEILKEYPELFKKFPFLEKMMYRDREYTELFGSFDDAKEIAEKSENFNNFENQLLSGNTEEILRGVKEADEK